MRAPAAVGGPGLPKCERCSLALAWGLRRGLISLLGAGSPGRATPGSRGPSRALLRRPEI